MGAILQGLKGTLVHMDDILIWGKDRETHDARLRAVLNRLLTTGMTLNPEKSVFGANSVTFLGHKVGVNGIEADASKVSAIVNMEQPSNVTEVQRFLGMVNFLGKYIPGKSEILEPIHLLFKE